MLRFEFSIQSSVYSATTVAKVSLFPTCKFLLYVSVEIDPFGCEKNRQFGTQTNLLYLGLVNVSMVTWTLL